jgi:hypothetical protein
MGPQSSKHQPSAPFRPVAGREGGVGDVYPNPSAPDFDSVRVPIAGKIAVPEGVLSEHEESFSANGERDVASNSWTRKLAREIRNSRQQSAKLDSRLEGIESVLEDIVRVVSALGQNQSDELAIASTNREEHSEKAAFRAEIHSLRHELETLTLQNEQLAGQIAQGAVRHSIGSSSDASATMSWEQRKALMFAEDESEQADAFQKASSVDTASGSRGDAEESLRAIEQLKEQQLMMEKLREDIQERDCELSQLRDLLEQRPNPSESGVAVGAAAIAQIMDHDELVCEERLRLQDLQAEWETKFRQMEIAASIERANLARERQQFERQNAELEEQLAHLKRELRQEEIAGPNQSRRWLAKLGLAE